VAFDDLAPTVKILVEGQELNADVTRAITRVEVDLTRDIADMIKLTVVNPAQDILGDGYGDSFVFLDSKAFQPGNRVEVSMGYGDDVSFIAAGIITKWLPSFPRSGVPMLQVAALDASHRLMDSETAGQAEPFDNFDLDTIVLSILTKHDIVAGEVTPLPGTGVGRTITKKRGMSDYKFVKGLANLAGHEFKIRFNPTTGQWEGFWRPPVAEQERQFTFRYNAGEESTLLKFNAQWGLRDQPTAVTLLYFDDLTRTWEEVTVEDAKEGEKLRFEGGTDRVLESINDASAVRISAGGVAVEVITERKFKSLSEALQFAERWLVARKNSFLTGRGALVGLEELRAGDVHVIEGVGAQLTGEWEFTTIRHVFDQAAGYTTEFFANKVVS
jgi:phage protein D